MRAPARSTWLRPRLGRVADADGGGPRVELLPTDRLTREDLAGIRALLDLGWPDPDEAFTDDDWDHALGGIHAFVRDADGRIVSHGSVVPRTLFIGERPVATGYVEAVSTLEAFRRRGLGSAVMDALDGVIREGYELGCLGTGEDRFYERLGWERWTGTLWVQGPYGRDRSLSEEGWVWVLRTPSSPSFTGQESLMCEARSGDDW